MRRLLIFASIFFALFCASFFLLSYEKKLKLEEHFQTKTKQYMQNYKVLYEEHKTLSELVFATRINTRHVVDIFKSAAGGTQIQKDESRLKLYAHLDDTYRVLKKFNVKQLHFHLPDNESFLRFHRPKKFGDNLTDIRSTVKYVNEFKKPIHGFEEGRIYNGYRFVFPLFDKQRYIGSVEISFSTFAMNIEFMRDYDVISNFLILKSVVENKVFKEERANYMPSLLNDFYLEKAMVEDITREKNIKIKEPLSQKTQDIVSERGESSDSFSLYDDVRKDIMTFIKVQNPISHKVVGLFMVRSSAHYVLNKRTNFYALLTFINLLILVVLYLIYKEMRYREVIELSNKKLYKSRLEVIEFNQTLEESVKDEVEKNRKKDKQILHHSRLAQMGEMISMIAHQWRQPLGVISVTAIDMKMQIGLEKFDLSKKEEQSLFMDYFTHRLDNIESLVQNLTTTIDDFRNFYKPNKESYFEYMQTPIDRALGIIKATLLSQDIELREDFSKELQVEMFTNEIVQVFLNIIKNSQDNFKEKGLENSRISILSESIENGVKVEICDNGGGIPDDIMEKIFDPYFSTKDAKNGSGLGLYMSKMIIEEHHGGKLSVKNRADGVCFTIELKGKIDE